MCDSSSSCPASGTFVDDINSDNTIETTTTTRDDIPDVEFNATRTSTLAAAQQGSPLKDNLSSSSLVTTTIPMSAKCPTVTTVQ